MKKILFKRYPGSFSRHPGGRQDPEAFKLNKKNLHLILIPFLVFLAGCVSVKSPNITEYTLNPHFKSIACRKTNKTIRLLPVNIVPQYSSLSFVYRLTDLNFTHDYYNAFFNKPNEQITQTLQTYLVKSKQFKLVLDDSGYMPTDYNLYAKVIKLYADYRDRAHPKAVVAMNFKLFNKKQRLVLNKTFSSRIGLKTKTSCALVVAWSQDLADIYRSFLRSL
ncbi:MAG: hypothetical protein JXR42_01825 [Gammaproteobacteria bacterium]|nr:hypothetical protein [Gammaproteobacteria bacterium]